MSPDKTKNNSSPNLTQRVLVTGAGGFLGGGIAADLAGRGYQVVGCDKTGINECAFQFEQIQLPGVAFEHLLEKEPPNWIIHAAGTASVAYSMDFPLDDFHSSTGIYAALLDSVRRFCPDCRVIFLSSAAVYGNPQKLPVCEDAPLNPISMYGYHKLLAEKLGQAYHRLYGMKICSLRIFSAFGENLKRQVIYDMSRQFLNQTRVELRGTGNESRDFIYINDIARAVEKVMRGAEFQAESYNVASGRETTIEKLAGLIRQISGSGAETTFDGVVRPGDPLNWRADVTKLGALGFTGEWDLRPALQRVIDIWRRQIPNDRKFE